MFSIKKILAAGAACFIAALPFASVTASAFAYDETLPRVVDDAGLLSDSEEKALEDRIDKITDKYDFDVVIVTEDSLDGQKPMDYADNYYDYNGYGAEGDRSGVLLLVGMENRDWWISTRGFGIKAFTDYGIEEAGEQFVPYLSDRKYSEGFEHFLDMTEDYVKAAKDGNPYDTNHTYTSSAKKILIAVGVGAGAGLIVALIVVLVFKSQLKSVGFQPNANVYEVPGSLNVRRSRDMFLYRNVTKRRKPQNNSSGGGSSTHSSSSGATHGGGGGHF